MEGSVGRVWGIPILAGLALAAALIVLPRPLWFEPEARDACEERGAAYVGLLSGAGRYADPVPEGARCLAPGDPSPIEIDVELLGTGAAWLYRLACIILPLAAALLIGARLRRPPAAPGASR